MPAAIVINTGELAVAHNDARIRTGGVGSCVIIVLYDDAAKVGGMAHAMLPSRRPGEPRSPDEAAAKYADESVDRLIGEIEKRGGRKERLRAKLVGGAQMFRILSGDQHGIGRQNVDAAGNRLRALAIPIDGEDTGGTAGRIAELNLENGSVEIFTKL